MQNLWPFIIFIFLCYARLMSRVLKAMLQPLVRYRGSFYFKLCIFENIFSRLSAKANRIVIFVPAFVILKCQNLKIKTLIHYFRFLALGQTMFEARTSRLPSPRFLKGSSKGLIIEILMIFFHISKIKFWGSELRRNKNIIPVRIDHVTYFVVKIIFCFTNGCKSEDEQNYE